MGKKPISKKKLRRQRRQESKKNRDLEDTAQRMGFMDDMDNLAPAPTANDIEEEEGFDDDDHHDKNNNGSTPPAPPPPPAYQFEMDLANNPDLRADLETIERELNNGATAMNKLLLGALDEEEEEEEEEEEG